MGLKKAAGSTPPPPPTTTTTTTPPPVNTQGNTTGVVASTPSPSGGASEYNLYLTITSSTVGGISAGQQVWLAATTADYPNLLTVGATVTGNLDHSPGWWVLKKASITTPPPPPTTTTTTTPPPVNTPGNTTGVVASTPSPSGATNEYNLYLNITSSTVAGISAGQQVWLAATTADFPNLLTVGATVTGNLDHSPGWWVLKK